MRQFTEETFRQEVVNSSAALVVVAFSSPACGPCRLLEPILERLSETFAGKCEIGKVDVSENMNLAMEYGIDAVPTILMFKHGRVFDVVHGLSSEGELAELFDLSLVP